jgi:hypothetical protein
VSDVSKRNFWRIFCMIPTSCRTVGEVAESGISVRLSRIQLSRYEKQHTHICPPPSHTISLSTPSGTGQQRRRTRVTDVSCFFCRPQESENFTFHRSCRCPGELVTSRQPKKDPPNDGQRRQQIGVVSALSGERRRSLIYSWSDYVGAVPSATLQKFALRQSAFATTVCQPCFCLQSATISPVVSPRFSVSKRDKYHRADVARTFTGKQPGTRISARFRYPAAKLPVEACRGTDNGTAVRYIQVMNPMFARSPGPRIPSSATTARVSATFRLIAPP